MKKDKKYLFTIKQTCYALGISRSSVYKLLEYNYLSSIQVLGRRMIPVQSVLDFINENLSENL